jgi:hypothetical protein
VPHLNQLVEKYGNRGFVVVGITGEGERETQKYVDDTAWKAIVGLEPGLASMREYGLNGFPSAALVGPKGKVLWKGHPAQLAEADLEKWLDGARVPGAPTEFDPLAIDVALTAKHAAIAKKAKAGQIGAALIDLEKVAEKAKDDEKPALESAAAELRALHEKELGLAAAATAEGRCFDASWKWTRLANAYKGHALADEPKAKLAEQAADAALAPEIAAGKEIHAARGLLEKDDVAGALKILRKLVAGTLRQTAEAKRAEALIAELTAEAR